LISCKTKRGKCKREKRTEEIKILVDVLNAFSSLDLDSFPSSIKIAKRRKKNSSENAPIDNKMRIRMKLISSIEVRFVKKVVLPTI